MDTDEFFVRCTVLTMAKLQLPKYVKKSLISIFDQCVPLCIDINIVLKRNIEALPLEFYDAQKADVWTMSPPCQPRTVPYRFHFAHPAKVTVSANICSQIQERV
jgi:hypothetical protein